MMNIVGHCSCFFTQAHGIRKNCALHFRKETPLLDRFTVMYKYQSFVYLLITTASSVNSSKRSIASWFGA